MRQHPPGVRKTGTRKRDYAAYLFLVTVGTASYGNDFKVYDRHGVERLETCKQQLDGSYKCYDRSQHVTRIIRNAKEYDPSGRRIYQNAKSNGD